MSSIERTTKRTNDEIEKEFESEQQQKKTKLDLHETETEVANTLLFFEQQEQSASEYKESEKIEMEQTANATSCKIELDDMFLEMLESYQNESNSKSTEPTEPVNSVQFEMPNEISEEPVVVAPTISVEKPKSTFLEPRSQPTTKVTNQPLNKPPVMQYKMPFIPRMINTPSNVALSSNGFQIITPLPIFYQSNNGNVSMPITPPLFKLTKPAPVLKVERSKKSDVFTRLLSLLKIIGTKEPHKPKFDMDKYIKSLRRVHYYLEFNMMHLKDDIKVFMSKFREFGVMSKESMLGIYTIPSIYEDYLFSLKLNLFSPKNVYKTYFDTQIEDYFENGTYVEPFFYVVRDECLKIIQKYIDEMIQLK